MAVLIRPRSWGSQQPPLGSSVDWGHPLAESLASCWLLNEGFGNQLRDLVSPNQTGTFATGVPRWSGVGAGVLAGQGPLFGGGGERIVLPNPSYYAVQSGASFTVLSWIATTTTSAITGLSFRCAPTIIGVQGTPTAGAFVFTTRNDANGLDQIFSSGAPATSACVLRSVAGTYAASGAKTIYVDGLPRGASSTSGSFTGFTTAGIGGDAITGNSGAATYGPQCFWRRALQPSEMEWLQAEPFAFILPPAPKILYFDLSTPAAPALTSHFYVRGGNQNDGAYFNRSGSGLIPGRGPRRVIRNSPTRPR